MQRHLITFSLGLFFGIFIIVYSANADVSEGRKAYDAGNYDAAYGYLKDAAEDGNAEAQFLLGECYFNGRGTRQDFQSAEAWFTESAEQNNVQAQEKLGNLYLNGKFFELNYELGVSWYARAGAQGNVEAALIAAKHYFRGEKVKRNF